MTIIDMNDAMKRLLNVRDSSEVVDVPYWDLPIWEYSPEIQNTIRFLRLQIP